MPLTPSLNFSQQPHRHGGTSPTTHDHLYDLRDGGEDSTLSTSQQAPPDVTNPACPKPLCPTDSSTHTELDLPCWKRLIRSPLTSHERISLITTIFSNRDEVEAIRRLSREDAQTFVDVIYQILDDLDHTLRMRCLRYLFSYDRTKVPLYRGGFADVWKGTSRGLEVAVKELKLYESSNQEQIRRGFCKEIVAWSTLRHLNVLPLLGATMTGDQLVMVSEWMVNGTINKFVEAHPDADRLELLRDVCKGLEYLHNQGIIHGDLKGANILINRNGRACIADFSLLMIIPDKANLISAISYLEGGTIRWTSPELLDPEPFGLKDSCQTKESDCYALGMVIYEVLSGLAPFSEYKDTVVIRKVMEGERPKRPRGRRAAWFTDDLWGMLELCWEPQPHDRPGLKALLERLEGVTSPSRSPSPTSSMDEDVVANADGAVSDFMVTGLGQLAISGGAQLPVPPVGLGGKTQAPQSVSQSPQPQVRPVESPSQDIPPINPEDLAKLGVDAQLIPFIVSTILRAEQSPSVSPPLSTAEAEKLVEILDKVVSSPTAGPNMKNRCFRILRRVSPTYGILPNSYFLPGVTLIDNVPHAVGGFVDIWKGQRDGNQVCVKALRTQTTVNLEKIKRRFYRDIVGWKHISHANVVPFLGISETLFSFCIFSPWLSGGNILEHIRKHRGVNRLQLLAQAACGLKYLHSLSIVHSAINPGNILITEGGIACLGDLGITGIITDPTVAEPGSMTFKPGLVRYIAPELLNPLKFNLANSNPSQESDVYSLAMTAFETLTEVLPYGNARDGIIIFHVVSGERPPRPTNAWWLQDHIWNMIMTCWSERREQRWDVRTVYDHFSTSSIQEVPDVEPDVEIIQTQDPATAAPTMDLPQVPQPLSVRVEESKPSARREAGTRAAKREKNLRSSIAPVPNSPRETTPRGRVIFRGFGGDIGESRPDPGGRKRLRKGATMSRGLRMLLMVIRVLRMFRLLGRFRGTDRRSLR